MQDCHTDYRLDPIFAYILEIYFLWQGPKHKLLLLFYVTFLFLKTYYKIENSFLNNKQGAKINVDQFCMNIPTIHILSTHLSFQTATNTIPRPTKLGAILTSQ